MRVVSYTRSTSCYPGAVISANAITEQNERIKIYAEGHGWRITRKYSDRKKDQTENSAFQQLLKDGLERQFDAVIVDSVFRAGKDLWNAREVLLQTFHFAGIWFIVVEDDFISVGKSNGEAEAYFDKMYGILRRENIRYRVNQRNRNGILSWNDVKYGYRLTEDYQLVVDGDTAPVVKRMFEMCASGMTPKEIAEVFTEEKIPIPLVSRGMNVKIDNPYQWDRLKIRRLLDKTVYIGYWTKVVQGEIVKFTNEPIVGEDVFQKVQEYLESIAPHAKPAGKKHPYSGLVCDKELGYCISLRKTKNGILYFAFASTPKEYDGKRQLPLSELEGELREALNHEKECARRIAARIKAEGESVKAEIKEQMRDEFQKRTFMLAEAQRERMEQYRRFGSGEISEDEMVQAEKMYQGTVGHLENAFQDYFSKTERIDIAMSEENPWLKLFLTWDKDLPFDREILRKYVSRITLSRMQIDAIEFPMKEWYMELPEDWRE